jgi:hypothetical protein
VDKVDRELVGLEVKVSSRLNGTISFSPSQDWSEILKNNLK